VDESEKARIKAEVLQLAGAISIHSCSIGIPALMSLITPPA
jgi:hypothetical protein